MLWKTHKRITKEVMKSLDIYLTREELSTLMEAAITPDKWQDWPHHYGKTDKIMEYVVKARKSFLQDTKLLTYYNLGIALHYIQDSYTTYPSQIRDEHNDWEQLIEDSEIATSFEIIQNSIPNISVRDSCSQTALRLVKEFQGKNETLSIATLNGQKKEYNAIASPEVDLYFGFWTSYVVSKSVLGPKDSPELGLQLRNLISNHTNCMKDSEVEVPDRIIKLIGKREELKMKKIDSKKTIPKIRNWITDLRIKPIEKEAIFTYSNYLNRSHLQNIETQYKMDAEKITYDHIGWYNFKIPQIYPNNIPRELLEIREISKTLNVDQNQFIQFLKVNNVGILSIQNHYIIKRSELDQILNRQSFNNLTKYPD